MKLFPKIFLWFLAAIALMVGVIILLNWTVQTEPALSRWQISIRNQTNIYAATAAQIFDNQGEPGLRSFIERLRSAETISEVDLVGSGKSSQTSGAMDAAVLQDLAAKALASESIEVENQPDTAWSAKSVSLGGEKYLLLIRWERPKAGAMFGEPPLRYIRYGVLLLTALLLCWALGRYLSSPIGKLREATRDLADGNLDTRVSERLGGRRDELADLARDFDDMAGRIERLVTSQQRLTRDVSHELRSPLARMNVALEIAKQRSTPETGPLLERIERESAQLNDMISRILMLAKLESGSDEVEHERVDMTGIVTDIVEDANFEAEAKGKSVLITRADACTVMGSDELLRSALENVVRNAVRYTAEGTAVEVAMSASGDRSKIQVTDHGGGVAEDELDNLFRPFYRIGESRERKTGGIGLGLAIAERAIKAHKGTIKATNSGDGLAIEITLACTSMPTRSDTLAAGFSKRLNPEQN